MLLPLDTYAQIAPRLGLATRNFINVGVGVLDSNYWGEVKVVLFNHSAKDFTIQVGEQIAQLMLERIKTSQVRKVAALDDANRVVGGFGSIGTKQLTQFPQEKHK